MDISEEHKIKCTDIVRTRIQDIKYLQNIQTDDGYVQRFLYSTGFDVDLAFERMLLYHETMAEQPEFYPKYSPLEKKHIFDLNFSVLLPGCDKEGRPIIYQKMGNLKPDEINCLDLIAIEDIGLEYFFMQYPEKLSKGICILVDIKNYSWKLLKWLQPSTIKKSNRRIDSLPIRDFRVHLVNSSTILDIAINIIWPFLSEERKKMVHPHFDNFESLNEHIDKSVLPKEYGGDVDINYAEMYQKIYDKNDEIVKNFQLYRNVKKCL